MNKEFIPFNKPFVSKKVEKFVKQSLSSSHQSGDGPMGQEVTALLTKFLGSKKIFLMPSCTHALETSIRVLNLNPGDEVIVPSFTFTSTANAIVLGNGIPVFVDVDSKTLNIDPDQVLKAISNKTRAIMVVHYAGVSANLNQLSEIAEKYNLVIIEDNAHGLFGTFEGKNLGSFGAMSTLSFHETKNIQCGEGGALVLNSDEYAECAEIFREKGTDRSKFFRGQIDKYSWISQGSSMLLADTLAAILVGQLLDKDYIQTQRQKIWNLYFTELSSWAEKNGYKLPIVPENATHPAHLFYLRAPDLATRSKLISVAKSNGVGLAFHYQALHSSPAGKQFGRSVGKMLNATLASDDLVRLPIWVDLSVRQLDIIIDTIKNSS